MTTNYSFVFNCLETESSVGPCKCWCCSPVLGDFGCIRQGESKAGFSLSLAREVDFAEQLFFAPWVWVIWFRHQEADQPPSPSQGHQMCWGNRACMLQPLHPPVVSQSSVHLSIFPSSSSTGWWPGLPGPVTWKDFPALLCSLFYSCCDSHFQAISSSGNMSWIFCDPSGNCEHTQKSNTTEQIGVLRQSHQPPYSGEKLLPKSSQWHRSRPYGLYGNSGKLIMSFLVRVREVRVIVLRGAEQSCELDHVSSTVLKSWGVSWEGIQFIQFGRGWGRGGGRQALCKGRLASLWVYSAEKEQVACCRSNWSKLCKMREFLASLKSLPPSAAPKHSQFALQKHIPQSSLQVWLFYTQNVDFTEKQ